MTLVGASSMNKGTSAALFFAEKFACLPFFIGEVFGEAIWKDSAGLETAFLFLETKPLVICGFFKLFAGLTVEPGFVAIMSFFGDLLLGSLLSFLAVFRYSVAACKLIYLIALLRVSKGV